MLRNKSQTTPCVPQYFQEKYVRMMLHINDKSKLCFGRFKITQCNGVKNF